ncbi:hypothetical protein JDV02_007344 [Purpureocillium takamizusanense]|uniref:ATP-dependent protease n=1 Tax=Purpureocillium takamizusanense TaxID=2060973 RepID=A0A9Q8VE15_9HYPO|nr:uncharacterized protein JDV02_007344 [Purpureocillium takamizusanense]UNI21347.1 hypothetical protein JDV02_007344 [Purpureocillium takamizusanense]
MQTDSAPGQDAAPAAEDVEPIWNPTPSADQVRDIVRLFQCRICHLPYNEPITLPCGRSMCKTCLPPTHARTAITYPNNPFRVQAFACPFPDCGKEHVLDDCGVDVVLNKAARIMANEINKRQTEAANLGITTNIQLPQPETAANETALSSSEAHTAAADKKLVSGDRLVATWALASEGDLRYDVGIEFPKDDVSGETPTHPDEATAFTTETLSKVQEAMRTEMDCQVCYTILYDPLTTGCGHTFCRPCLHRVLDHSYYCPACRRRLFMSPLLHRNACPSNTIILNITEIFWKNELLHRERVIAADRLRELDNVELPLFVCTLAFPDMPTFLHIFEPRYRLMIRRVLDGNKTFGMVLPKEHTRPGEMHFFELGTLLRIVNAQFYPDGRCLIETVGVYRFRVTRFGELDGYAVGETERIVDVPLEEEEALEASEVGSDEEDSRGRSPPMEGGTRGETYGTTNGTNGSSNATTHNQRQPSSTEALSDTSHPSQESTDWVPKTATELNWMTTQELFRFATDFVQRTQEKNIPWLTERMLNIYGPPPQDPAKFPWWLASTLPVNNAEKYRLLGTSSVRDRLKICGTWILEMQKVHWAALLS